MSIRILATLPIALALVGLSACSFEAGPTVEGEKLAEAAADALEGQVGERPDIDCGDESIIVTKDKEVVCTLTDAASGDEYDATVTFTSVDGAEFQFDVVVAETPR